MAGSDTSFPVRKYQIECQEGESMRVIGPLERRKVQPLVMDLLSENRVRRMLVWDVTG